MSIYRKFAGDPGNEVFATTANRPEEKKPALTPADIAREEAERKKRSKGEPMNAPLPRTKEWVARLPEELRPNALMRAYARIANILATSWDDPDATSAYFDQLLVDRRGHRQGFPPDVMAELLALRTHSAGLHPISEGLWDHLTKR